MAELYDDDEFIEEDMLPSLMRIFCGSDHVVEYAPTGPEDVEMAKQATDYVNYILNQDQDQSYIEIIYATMKDALVKGSGFIKYCYDESEKTQSYELENLDDEALAAFHKCCRLEGIIAPGVPDHQRHGRARLRRRRD